ncbi:MAG: secondary thiamine-phosphate synthase enzyme YjbQ [Eubacteriales bacterium]|nr:secondary thiamine-phosphate synthase enzyme YjbQ [Eubacteriales bacterium]MDD4323616.1 secondary thiamine-phosphate synthase enzyme YjbQ [Eubacteriales bacterium]MDD4540750.1 secondary thiamine-phosphate synthase enzyme YjbQ [Eubacteriales bacterium]
MLKKFSLKTDPEGFYNITAAVESYLRESGIESGICLVYCPHTTAAITVNENADPDVRKDMLLGLNRTFPDDPDYRHYEGNSSAHLKSSTIGCSTLLIIEHNQLVRGTWQGIYFVEFDGPRNRHYYVKLISD